MIAIHRLWTSLKLACLSYVRHPFFFLRVQGRWVGGARHGGTCVVSPRQMGMVPFLHVQREGVRRRGVGLVGAEQLGLLL